ncbi:MAG: redoxin domain-containing protein [Candidatus Lokiarchaeota archaeon]|nr:redoxin domain-containing protein [Candidatus Lokiarchaeota archaeon]
MSTDSNHHLEEYRDENNLKFNQVSDRGAKIAKKYNISVYDKGAGKDIKFKQAMPTKFLIDKSGKIVWRFIPKEKTERPPIDLIINAIDENF